MAVEVALNQIQEKVTTFVKFMKEEELLQKRRKLEVEIYKIDQELSDLNKNIFSIMGRDEAWKKVESLMANVKIKK